MLPHFAPPLRMAMLRPAIWRCRYPESGGGERVPQSRVVWAGGASMWTPSSEGRTIPSLLSHISYTIYSNCTAIYCTMQLLNTRLLQSEKLPVSPRVFGRVCLLGLHAATLPWAACTRTVVQLVHLFRPIPVPPVPVFDLI